MGNVFVNSTGAVEGSWTVESDPRTGPRTIRRFRGERPYIEAKELELRSIGYTTRTTQGPVWDLEASIAAEVRDGAFGGTTADSPVDTYELFANVVEKDVLDADQGYASVMNEDDRAWLRAYMDGDITDKKKYNGKTVNPPFVDPTLSLPLFRMILRGTKSIIQYQPVLRHTRTIWSGYSIGSALDGVATLWSKNDLAGIGIPALILNNLPASGTVTASDGLVQRLAFLKAYPTIQAASYGKSQAVVEWQYGKWGAGLYDLYNISEWP